jgi:signal transduction histidine kinase
MDQTRHILNMYYWIGFSMILLMVFLIFYISHFYYKTLFSKQKNLQHQMMDEVLKSRESEQVRIARDLHDGVLGDLAAIRFSLNLFKNQLTTEQQKFVIQTEEQLQKITQEIRGLCHDLVPPILETVGLVKTLQTVLEEKAQRTGKQIELIIDYVPKLSAIDDLHILRLIQEWLSNHFQHNQSNQFQIRFLPHNDQNWKIVLQDNGEAYQWKQLMQQSQGLGWKNLQARVMILQGNVEQLEVASGNKLEIIIPIRA